MKKKKIRTQNIHEFRSSFILNMNKKEYKSRKFNHNNTNLEKKNYRQETFLAFSYTYNQTQITSKNIQPNTTKTSQTHTHTHTHSHTKTMEIWPWWHTYSQSAMDEPPQALSPLPTASPVVRFSSPFSYCKTLFLLSWVFLLLFFREDVEFFLFYGFIVCLFPKKISGFMGLLEIWLVTVFVSQNFSANPFLWFFCRFFTSIWLGI